MLGTPELQSRVARWADGAQILTGIDVPAYLLESTELPYEAGTIAVAAMYAAGGWIRVNAALSGGDLLAAQVLHPERVGIEFVNVAAPRGDDLLAHGMERIATRSLGEIELRLYLGRVMRVERAALLASAWRGDAMALFADAHGDLAVIWDIVCVDEPSAIALAQSVMPLAERWRRDGCAGVRGGVRAPCPASIVAVGRTVRVARGE